MAASLRVATFYDLPGIVIRRFHIDARTGAPEILRAVGEGVVM